MSQRPIFKLKDWLKDFIDYLDFNELSKNPLSIDLIKQYPEKINRKNLCLNRNLHAISLIEKIENKDFKYLSKNINAIDILKKNPDKIDIFELTSITIINENYFFCNFEYSYVDLIIKTCNPKLILNNINWNEVCYNNLAIDLIDKLFNFDIILINFAGICANKNIVYFFKKYDILNKYSHKIHWKNVCFNKYAMPIIESIMVKFIKSMFTYTYEKYEQKYESLDINDHNLYYHLDWYFLSSNPEAIPILERFKYNINYDGLSFNQKGKHLLEKNKDCINWKNISANEGTIELLEKNPDKINWIVVSSNKKAIPLFKKYPEKVHWDKALKIKDPEIIDIVGTYVKKIQLAVITDNSHVLKVVKSMLNWTVLSQNPYIFEIDYEAMSEKLEPLSRELNDYLCIRPHLLPRIYEN